jgi:uncharacterized protein YjbI with pentapeptide repeats
MSEEDNVARTPANENPWYWLATVYGEQEEGKAWHQFDRDVAEKNRAAWNRWMAQALSEETKAELIGKGFVAAELVHFDDSETAQFFEDFAARSGRPNAAPPDPRGRISLPRVEFARPVDFAGFLFASEASFHGASFSGHAFFRRAVFFDNAGFEECAFSRAMFHYTKFFALASFSRARFSRRANFGKAEFFGDAYFNDVAFPIFANFGNAEFSGLGFFNDASFSGVASFIGAEFKSQTSFAGVNFQGVPDFRNATLREATEWHGVEWPLSPTNRDEAQQQVYAYEKLKAEMERLKKHVDEQMFFAKELRARRALEPFLSLKWLLYFVYEQFGGYGQSVVRPFVSLAILWALGAGLFALLPATDGWPLDYETAARLSFTNLIPFLPYKPGEAVMNHLEAWAKWLGILQAILGTALLFLFGLALRNLFRMK